MTATSPQISRRTITKGASWSIPIMAIAAAAPAMAVSATADDYTYGFDTMVTERFRQSSLSGCVSESLTFTNEANAGGFGIYGFIAGTTNPQAATAATGNAATLTSLVYYVAVPKGIVDSWNVSNRAYTVTRLETSPSLALPDGTVLSAVDGRSLHQFDVFSFTFTGTGTTNDVHDVSRGGSPAMTWPGTRFTAEASFTKNRLGNGTCHFTNGSRLSAASVGTATYTVNNTSYTVTGTRVVDNSAVVYSD